MSCRLSTGEQRNVSFLARFSLVLSLGNKLGLEIASIGVKLESLRYLYGPIGNSISPSRTEAAREKSRI